MNDNSKNNLNPTNPHHLPQIDGKGIPSDDDLMRLNIEKLKAQLENLKQENQRKDVEIKDLSEVVKKLIQVHSGNFPEAMSKIRTVNLVLFWVAERLAGSRKFFCCAK